MLTAKAPCRQVRLVTLLRRPLLLILHNKQSPTHKMLPFSYEILTRNLELTFPRFNRFSLAWYQNARVFIFLQFIAARTV